MAEYIEQLLVETPDDVVQNTATEIKKPFCEEVNKRYVAIDGVTTKKSSSVWSLHDYTCEACGKIFTQSPSLHKHKNTLARSWKRKTGQKKNAINAVKSFQNRLFTDI